VSTLAKPLSLPCGATLPNRIVKAAMSELLAHRKTGAPTDRLMNLYERWASGGAGMLLTGNVIVAPEAREGVGNVVVEDETHLPLLARWAEVAQAGGARLWMQISHAGRQTPKRATRDPVAPSAVGMHGLLGAFRKPRELAADEISWIIGRYAATAELARRAGFAGVQIHGAHGYLISQFLSPLSNLRTDDWGGDEDKRMRFLLEVVRAVRAAVGASFPVGVKLNSADFQRGGFGEDESMHVVEALEREGVDLLEISGGNYESPVMFDTAEQSDRTRAREAYFLEYAQRVRAVAKMPLLLTGGLRSAAAMTEIIESGAVDAVGMARPLCVEPDLPARLISAETQAAALIPPRIGIRIFDTMLQAAWYQAQIRRMGRGHAPKPNLSRWGALMSGYARSYAFNPFRLRGRPRKALPAPAKSS